MPRPKKPDNQKHVKYNTTMSPGCKAKLKEVSDKTNIPMARLIERALWKLFINMGDEV